MQHVFIDVEAYGPPGIGRPFALGAAKFDSERRVYARAQWNIDWSGAENITADQRTMNWLLEQEPRVLAQTRGGQPFGKVWLAFRDFVFADGVSPRFYADDWSDFAWLDIEARRALLNTIRDWGAPQYDTSVLVTAADPLQVYSEVLDGELVPHVAEHDAVRGALDLIAALHGASSHWRNNLGLGS